MSLNESERRVFMDTSIFTAFSGLLKVSGVQMLQSLVQLQASSSISLFDILSVVHRVIFKLSSSSWKCCFPSGHCPFHQGVASVHLSANYKTLLSCLILCLNFVGITPFTLDICLLFLSVILLCLKSSPQPSEPQSEHLECAFCLPDHAADWIHQRK